MPETEIDDIEFKAAPAGQVSVSAKGIVECFVAGIGNKDSVGDICAPGAFNGSLKRRKPRVVWGHNWNDPIGKVLEIYEVPASDPRLPEKMKRAGIGGLYAKVQFNLNSEKGREAFANVQFFGLEQEWSIGYKTLDAVFDPAKQANVLKEVELYEVSPVLHGANQLTGTISIKGAKQKLKDPKGGLTAAGRRHFARSEGANLKPGVKGPADTPQKMRRKGSFLTRFFTNPSGPMKKPNGKPTRLALSAAAWGEPVPQNASDAAKLAAKGRRLLDRYENAKKKDADWFDDDIDFSDFEAYFAEEFVEMKSDDAWWDFVDFDDFDEKGHMMMRMIPVRKPEPQRDIFAEGEARPLSPEKRNNLEMEIASRVQAPIKLLSATENLVVFVKMKPDGSKRFYRLPYHWDVETSQYMFGKPERVMPRMSWEPMQPTNIVVPQQMPSMPMRVKPSDATSRAYLGPKPEPTMANVFQSWEKDEDDEEKSLEYMTSYTGFETDAHYNTMVECSPEQAFYVKSALDPILEYYDVQAEVTEEGVKFLGGVSDDFVDAVHNASKHFFGGGSKKALRSLRGLTARFDPNAIDGDEDGLVQEGTPFERPATPRVPSKPRMMDAKPTVNEVAEGMRSSRARDTSRLFQMDRKQLEAEIDDAVDEAKSIVEQMKKDFPNSKFDNYWLMSKLDGSYKDLDRRRLANLIVAMDGKGVKDRDADVDEFLREYENSFLSDLGRLQDAEDRIQSLRSHVEDVQEMLYDASDREKDSKNNIDEITKRMQQIQRSLRMSDEELEQLQESDDIVRAADRWMVSNFDPDQIEERMVPSTIAELIDTFNEIEQAKIDGKYAEQDREWAESAIGKLDEVAASLKDPKWGYRDNDPFFDPKRLDEAKRKISALRSEMPSGGRGGMASRRNGGNIQLGIPARDAIRHAETLYEYAERPDVDEVSRRLLNNVADGIDPGDGPSMVERAALQQTIDLLNYGIADDDSGALLETAEYLERIKNGAKNGMWVDSSVDPAKKQINSMSSRSNVRIPDSGVSLKISDDERGDIRRVLEKNKKMWQGIPAISEYDKWLQGSSDKMPADLARRVVAGMNDMAKRNENRDFPNELMAAKDFIDLAALAPNGVYESSNFKKGGGLRSSRPTPAGMTPRNLSDLLSWGQTEGDAPIRDRFSGLSVADVSPKGWAVLDGARGMRSERGSGAPTPERSTVDAGKATQRGRPVGTDIQDTRLKGKKWDDIKPDNWDELTLDQQFDDLYALYSPKKSGLREADFQRLQKQILEEMDREERKEARRARRRQFASEIESGQRQVPSQARQVEDADARAAREEAEAQQTLNDLRMTPEDAAKARRKDMTKLERRIAGNGSRISDALNDGDAGDSHRDFWDAASDILNESDDLTFSQIESLLATTDDYLDEFRGSDMTASESASIQGANGLKNLLEEMMTKYSGDPNMERGDSTAALRPGGVDENDIPNTGTDAARFLSDGGMRSFRNYKPSATVENYVAARSSSGMRSAKAGRTQIVDEATFFADVERSLSKEITEAGKNNDAATIRGLNLLQSIMRRQESGKTGSKRTNVGTITVTQEEVDQILDALMVVLDRQMDIDGSRIDMFAKMIEKFAQAAMSTFVDKTTDEITSRTQQRTNSQGRTVDVPNN